MLLAAALTLTALSASADSVPQLMGNDALSRQILTKTAQANGGVTAAVRVKTGQVIELNLADVSAAPVAALAPAAATPAAALKPAEGLAPKPKAKPKRPPHRAIEHLKHIAEKKAWSAER